MKILCTKDEFAELLHNCDWTKTQEVCEHCILYDGTEPFQCSAHLVSECEIVPESGE